MKLRTIRTRIAAGAALTMAALAGTFALSGVASADPVPGQAPQFYTGFNSQVIRSSGSDTTFYMMQAIADLYNQAGLYGCQVTSTTSYPCKGVLSSTPGSLPASASSTDIAPSDDADNWDRTEVLDGVDDVGSGDGQKQLCGAAPSNANPEYNPDATDFSRSSKPIASTPQCTEEESQGYAYDGVPIVDWQMNSGITPATFGSVEATVPVGGPAAGSATPWYTAIDSPSNLAANSSHAEAGSVAAGWIPGDPASCIPENLTGVESGTPCSGTPLLNVSNSGGANSEAFRIWCATNGGGVTNQISDWGALTNLGPNLVVVDANTTGGASDVTINGGAPEGTTFPAVIASGDAVTGIGIPAGWTVSGSGGGGSTLTITGPGSLTSNADTNLDIAIGNANVLTAGNGVPFGVPIVDPYVNPASGTNYTLAHTFLAPNGAPSTPSSLCVGSGAGTTTNQNAATSASDVWVELESPGVTQPSTPYMLENDAANLADYAATAFPGDAADQAVMVSATLYYESNGVVTANPYARQAGICSNGQAVNSAALTPCGAGTLYSFPVTKVKENGIQASPGSEANQTLPTARALFNIFLDAPVPAYNSAVAPSTTVTNASTTSGSPVVTTTGYSTGSPAPFSQADIGVGVSGTGIAAGTYITQIGPAGEANYASGAGSNPLDLPENSIELSQPATGTDGPETITLSGLNQGLRASTAGFLNFICGTNGDGVVTKAKDPSTGLNFDTELTNIIDNQFGFNRITDLSLNGDQAGSFSGDCGLIYPTYSDNAVSGNGGSQLSDPYPNNANLSVQPLGESASNSAACQGTACSASDLPLPFPDN
ncbi:MAG TPA: hypothetical protein VK428_15355 [Acidimicrobiales bacterium]|nr:hypothetical protein [Acidimicrobiales bacterium]